MMTRARLVVSRLLVVALLVVGAGVFTAQPASAFSRKEITNWRSGECVDATTVQVQVMFCDQRLTQSWNLACLEPPLPGPCVWNFVHNPGTEHCLRASAAVAGSPVQIRRCDDLGGDAEAFYRQLWSHHVIDSFGAFELVLLTRDDSGRNLCLTQYGYDAIVMPCTGSRHQHWITRDTV